MINFVILCGGYGTRFQDISKKIPKILIEINHNLTMIDWLINEYLPEKSRIIFATGHLHEKIYQYVNTKGYKKRISFSYEKEKLGTGGAIINASKMIDTDDFIVLNGDTIQEIKISDFLIKSELNNNEVINLGCTTAEINDSGKLLIEKNNSIVSFTEKTIPKYISRDIKKVCSSIGIYRCRTNYFKELPLKNISLEHDMLPKLIEQKKAKATIFNKLYHDFGTAERYKNLIKKNN